MNSQRMAIKVTKSTEKILDVLKEGRATPGYLADETDISRQTIHTQLNALLAGKYIQQVHEPTGLYELVNDPREEDTES
ncbi:MarR family transcriptional regulator [Haladaptatus pallidirubidus]|uniref:HTH marR-type domain-containing protein n=1 Tax=Haladaptatus pallidirubidus TaxID=1008152 RepID=A0AAV3UGE8_9EURY|nr:winged helix-turn-helix domain-containing protein [Haladaptatus pallidirubidus]